MIEETCLYKVTIDYFEGGSTSHRETLGVAVRKSGDLKSVEKVLKQRFDDFTIVEATRVFEGDIMEEDDV